MINLCSKFPGIPIEDDFVDGDEEMNSERENDIRSMRAMEHDIRMMRGRFKVKENNNNNNNNMNINSNSNKNRINAMNGMNGMRAPMNEDKYRFEDFRASQPQQQHQKHQFDDEEERAVGYKRRPDDRHKPKYARPIRGASLGFDSFWQNLGLGFPLNLFLGGLGLGGNRNFGIFF